MIYSRNGHGISAALQGTGAAYYEIRGASALLEIRNAVWRLHPCTIGEVNAARNLH